MNELISIQALTNELGISTRTLRHYEDVGLLTSVRLPDKQQRYYSDDAIRRIHQIRMLRKMEIPIKDIISIYENAETTNIIEVFTQKITSIDENIATLTELRSIVEDFRQELLRRGISSVSDLPALIDIAAEHKPAVNRMEQLESVSEKRKRELLMRYMDMRPMRVLSNYRKGSNRTKAFCKGKRWEEKWNKEYERIAGGKLHEHYGDYFEGHSAAGHILHRRIPDNCVNDSPYEDYMLGGLFIAETTSNDPTGYDPEELWAAMEAWLKDCDYLELDSTRDPVYGINFGGMTKEEGAMWDLLIPVKKILSQFEVKTLPKLWIVGKEIRYSWEALESGDNRLPAFWNKCIKEDIFAPLQAQTEHVFNSAQAGVFHSWEMGGDRNFSYVVGMLMKEGVTIPTGYAAHELPAADVAVGWYKNNFANRGAQDIDGYNLMAKTLNENGRTNANMKWCAELYDSQHAASPDENDKARVYFYTPLDE